MSEIRRQTAYKCSIKQLLDSRYVQQQGLNPNYIDLGKTKAARLNILAILISKEGNTLIVDDGTGQMQVMLFEEYQKKNLPNLGELIMLVGKPREYNEKRFFVPEIIKVLDNHKWIEHRKKELIMNNVEIEKKPQKEKETTKEPILNNVENHQEKIFKKIKELDKGDGVSYNDLIKSLKIKNIEKEIEDLLKEGEIFEIKGKLKMI